MSRGGGRKEPCHDVMNPDVEKDQPTGGFDNIYLNTILENFEECLLFPNINNIANDSILA